MASWHHSMLDSRLKGSTSLTPELNSNSPSLFDILTVFREIPPQCPLHVEKHIAPPSMPTWCHIEDASAAIPRVWLSREKKELSSSSPPSSSSSSPSSASTRNQSSANASSDETVLYKPLRKVDCRALNERFGNCDSRDDGVKSLGTVLVESGRATADLDARTLTYNFYNAPQKEIISAAWFTREERSSDEILLHPLSEGDGDKVEAFYHRIIAASSSLGAGLNTIIKEEVHLDGEKGFKVLLKKVGGSLTMKKQSISMFGASYNLQRGYSPYTVPGEEDEVCLGPPTHLFFAIHGIGEAMWSRQDVKIPSLIAQTDETRMIMNRKLAEDWRAECTRKEKLGEPRPLPPNRIEVLPIEWYSKIHSASSNLKNALMAVTLRNIPRLRAIANDVVFDVLMYLTPCFCEEVLVTVTRQVIDVYEKFHNIHPAFSFLPEDGKCSFLGHSLGSVIVWDMLSVLRDQREKESTDFLGQEAAHIAYAKENKENSNAVTSGTWGPLLTKRIDEHIPFVPKYTIFLGSPLGLFLSLRGAQPKFDMLRQSSEPVKNTPKTSDTTISSVVTKQPEESKASPFSLPSGDVYNIFHPSDPVAYRIEPLLMPPGTPDKNIPSPLFLTSRGKGVRLHVRVSEATKNISKSVTNLFGSLDKVVNAAAEIVAAANEDSRRSSDTIDADHIFFALGGKAGRVDYQLQTGVIDNEYLSAISAHGCYFNHEDFLDFIIGICNP